MIPFNVFSDIKSFSSFPPVRAIKQVDPFSNSYLMEGNRTSCMLVCRKYEDMGVVKLFAVQKAWSTHSSGCENRPRILKTQLEADKVGTSGFPCKTSSAISNRCPFSEATLWKVLVTKISFDINDSVILLFFSLQACSLKVGSVFCSTLENYTVSCGILGETVLFVLLRSNHHRYLFFMETHIRNW